MRNGTNVFNSLCELLLSNKSKIKYFLGLMLCVVVISSDMTAAPSDLDPTFGTGGKTYFAATTAAPPGYGMALQPDGKIIMIGGYGGSSSNFAVARFNADGSPDTTFGTGGAVQLTFGGSYEIGYSAAVQPDGKIVVGGMSSSAQTGRNAVIARLNPNGSLDTTFDGDGKVIVVFTSSSQSRNSTCSTVKIASDGKIVLAGYSDAGLNFSTIMGRLNTDGSLDTTFNGTGTLFSTGSGIWEDITVRSDGTIFAVGYYSTQFTTTTRFSKINPNGTYAWSVVRGDQNQVSRLYGVAEQPDGKVVAVGQLNGKIIAMRLNENGTTDTSFIEAVVTPNGQAKSVAIQPDGKIVACIAFGITTNGFSLVRYNPNGSLDRGFGNNGIVITNFGSDGSTTGRDVIVQPDGKILVGGSFGDEGGNYFVMVRYQGGASAPLRTSFDYDGDGRADVSVFRPSENRWYILKSSDSSFIQPFFGAAGDVPTPADYDGDGKTDIAIWRPSTGVWWYLSSVTGAQLAAQWGQNGDIPRPSDFDGDGKTDFIIYRPAEGRWYRLSGAGGSSIVAFGAPEDKPVIGDFDGDGKSDPAIYRPSTGVWWYAASSLSGAQRAVQFGTSTDIPVPADYDGDGKTDLAVYRASEGGWHILRSGNGSYYAFPFGDANDRPVAADYDGDGKADAGVFRASNGSWYLLRSTNGFSGVQWGVSTDIPTQNSFIP